MMDELELLKKDWQKKEGNLPKLSYDQIYKMIWKKSSSIVKWIFYISILEFIFWILLSFLPVNTETLSGQSAKTFGMVETILEVVNYLVIVYFIYQFYQNYRKISVTDTSKDLMKNIIKTRKTVMQYVWFNLILFAVLMIVVFFEFVGLNPDSELTATITEADNSTTLWIIVGVLLVVAILFFAFLLWLFYKLLYGILLKQLNENYKELKKLEV